MKLQLLLLVMMASLVSMSLGKAISRSRALLTLRRALEEGEEPTLEGVAAEVAHIKGILMHRAMEERQYVDSMAAQFLYWACSARAEAKQEEEQMEEEVEGGDGDGPDGVVERLARVLLKRRGPGGPPGGLRGGPSGGTQGGTQSGPQGGVISELEGGGMEGENMEGGDMEGENEEGGENEGDRFRDHMLNEICAFAMEEMERMEAEEGGEGQEEEGALPP